MTEKREVKKSRSKSKKLLQHKTTVSAATVQRFVASERLAAANIGWRGENFNRLFLDKVEENVLAGRIAISSLVRTSLDPEIMVALGRTRRVTRLAHFFQLLEKQAKGQTGPLLTNGMANIAYCVGSDGNVWAVSAHWHSFGHCWYVGAHSVGGPREWIAGLRVLSQVA